MKHILNRILVFVSILIFLSYLLHFLILSCIYRINTGGYGVINKIIGGKINTEILITGSSRAHVHFNPEVISRITKMSCYNIGQDGEQLNLQLPLLKTYLKYNKPPRILVQSLDIFSLELKKDIVNKSKYYPYLTEDIIYRGLLKITKDIWLQKYIPLYGFINYSDIFYIIDNLGRKKDTLINGYAAKHFGWKKDFENFKKQSPEGKIFNIEKDAVNHLKEIIKLCREKNIEIVFVYSPEYTEAYPFERNRDEIMDRFNKIAFENNTTFIDYSYTPICKNKMNFYNASHLNANGANKFSEDFAMQLLNLKN